MKLNKILSILAVAITLTACEEPVEDVCTPSATNKPDSVVRVNAKFKDASGDLLENEEVKGYAVVFKKDAEEPVVYESLVVTTHSETAEATIDFENEENIDDSNVEDVVVQFAVRFNDDSALEAVLLKNDILNVKTVVDAIFSSPESYISYGAHDSNCKWNSGDVYTVPGTIDVVLERPEMDSGGRLGKKAELIQKARNAIQAYKTVRGLN